MLRIVPSLAASGGFDPTDHVAPWPLFEVGPLTIGPLSLGPATITNQMLMAAVATVMVLAACVHASRRIAVRGSGVDAYLTRGRFSQVIEAICEFLREQVARPNLGHLTDRYIGYVWSMFFFILFCNLLGLVPVGAALKYSVEPLLGLVMANPPHLEHWGGTATGSLTLTLAMALVSFAMFHFVGIRHQGWRYFKHFNPGPLYMSPMLVPLEVLGSFVKAFALGVRLFANMVGGHLIVAAMFSIIYMFGSWYVAGGVVLACVALMFLELFVALLQAYVFTMLTVMFIAMGAVHHDDGHEDGHARATAVEN